MPNPTIRRRNDSGGELSSEINAFVQELYGMKLGWTITSTKRGKPGSRHHSFDAMDVGVWGSDDASMLQFFFGEDFDPSDYSNMGKIKMTDDGLAFCKRHNIRILDERNADGGPHFHFEAVTEDTADNVVESEDEATYHTEGRLVTIHETDAYEYGIQVVKNEHTYVKNDYNKSEEYQNSVKDGENVDLTAMTTNDNNGIQPKTGGVTEEIKWVNTNETILNNESTEEELVSEEPLSGKISGVVTNTKTGDIIPNSKVTITDQDGNTQVVTADENGTYTSENIDINKNYTISIKNDAGEELEKIETNSEDFVGGNITRDLNMIQSDSEEIEEEVVVEEEIVPEEEVVVDKETSLPKLEYKVQVGVWEGERLNEKTQSLLNRLREDEGYTVIKELDKGILYRYSMYKVEDGPVTTKEAADRLQKELRNFGFVDAFTYAEKTENDELSSTRIPMAQAEKLELSIRMENISNTGGVNYRVKVGVVEGDVNEKTQAVFDKIEESGEYVIKKELDKGIIYSYTAERKDGANTLEDAESIKKAMNDAGIKDAFIYAEDKSGNRINMGEAAEAQKKYNEKKKEEEVDEKDLEGDINEDAVEEAVEVDEVEVDEVEDVDEVEELDEQELLDQEWREEEIEELEKNKEYIDEIFAENPEIAAKYEGVPIEKYSEIDGYYEEVYEPMYEKEEVALENQRQVNKEATGVLETNEERTKRESDTARFNELEEKKNNNTITAEEQTELTNLMYSYGNNDLNELYESNKVEQAEKDANKESGKGDVTNVELEQQERDKEIESEELEAEREENFRLYGTRETDEQKYTRIEKEKDENEEKGLGRLTNVQVEDENVIFSTPNSEKALRNELKKDLKNKEDALEASDSEEEKFQIDKDIKTTNLALEYLELKKEYGNKDDVFDINTFREAVENNDNQQISMFYNDQRGAVINKLESQRKSIVDGSFEGTEKEKEKILSTLEKINISTQKSELPEFDSEYDKLLYMTNSTNEDINKLKALEEDKKLIEKEGKVNVQIIDLANQDVANSGVTDTDMSANNKYVLVENPKDGTSKYVLKDWVNSFSENEEEIERLEKKETNGTILPEEKITLKNYKANNFHSRDILSNDYIFDKTKGHPDGIAGRYRGGTDEVDLFIANRKKKIFETGANPDINLSPEQIAKFDEIKSEDYDISNLENDLDQIISYNPEAFEFDTELESVEEPRSMGPTAQELLKGTMDVANGIMDSFGGPDALINAVMGKKALAAAMKDVTPMEQAKLSPMFQEHLRETKELSKRGYHPSEELKIRRGIDKAYQQGLENSIRGTAGDRAKYLASSGIFDAQRTSALLEVSAQDAALQRENQKQYSELLVFKENFDSEQQESKRTENLQMQLANKKAASEFAGLTFANALQSMRGSNSLLDQIKNGLANTQGGYNISSKYEDNTNLNENEE